MYASPSLQEIGLFVSRGYDREEKFTNFTIFIELDWSLPSLPSDAAIWESGMFLMSSILAGLGRNRPLEQQRVVLNVRIKRSVIISTFLRAPRHTSTVFIPLYRVNIGLFLRTLTILGTPVPFRLKTFGCKIDRPSGKFFIFCCVYFGVGGSVVLSFSEYNRSLSTFQYSVEGNLWRFFLFSPIT